jgi:hypothetical protein
MSKSAASVTIDLPNMDIFADHGVTPKQWGMRHKRSQRQKRRDARRVNRK